MQREKYLIFTHQLPKWLQPCRMGWGPEQPKAGAHLDVSCGSQGATCLGVIIYRLSGLISMKLEQTWGSQGSKQHISEGHQQNRGWLHLLCHHVSPPQASFLGSSNTMFVDRMFSYSGALFFTASATFFKCSLCRIDINRPHILQQAISSLMLLRRLTVSAFLTANQLLLPDVFTMC